MVVASVGWVTVAKTEQSLGLKSNVWWVTVANTEWGWPSMLGWMGAVVLGG